MFYLVIRTENLTKYYGHRLGVKDLTLSVEPGEVFGFLGPQGAGKTTTIRMLLDFVRPSSGRALVLGREVRKNSLEVRRQVGFLPSNFAFARNMTGESCLRYLAGLRGPGSEVSWDYVRELSTRLGVGLNQKISELTSGDLQKIGLVQAFMHKPELMLLDEPARGLDADAQRAFFQLVADARAEGRTVFYATSMLQEVERVCDRVAVINQGQLVTVERAVRLRGRALRKVQLRFSSPISPEIFASLTNVENIRMDENWMTCTVQGDPDALIKLASQYRVTDIISQSPSLEESFKRYYGIGGYAV